MRELRRKARRGTDCVSFFLQLNSPCFHSLPVPIKVWYDLSTHLYHTLPSLYLLSSANIACPLSILFAFLPFLYSFLDEGNIDLHLLRYHLHWKHGVSWSYRCIKTVSTSSFSSHLWSLNVVCTRWMFASMQTSSARWDWNVVSRGVIFRSF